MKRRTIALDIGSVRIGVAVSDPLGMFAQGIAVLQAESDWMSEMDILVEKYDPEVLLIGLPIRTGGERGPEAERVEELSRSLAGRYPSVSVVLHDERFSTTIATRALIEGDVSRRGRKGKVDMVAAAVILQSWIDREGSS
ncbi:MAG: Holliday junction resolvase RuvX [Aminobacteriaceae bacterium]